MIEMTKPARAARRFGQVLAFFGVVMVTLALAGGGVAAAPKNGHPGQGNPCENTGNPCCDNEGQGNPSGLNGPGNSGSCHTSGNSGPTTTTTTIDDDDIVNNDDDIVNNDDDVVDDDEGGDAPRGAEGTTGTPQAPGGDTTEVLGEVEAPGTPQGGTSEGGERGAVLPDELAQTGPAGALVLALGGLLSMIGGAGLHLAGRRGGAPAGSAAR